MPDTALVTILLSAGVAGVFCILFITRIVVPGGVVTDLREENKAKDQALAAARAALEAERDRGDTLERIVVNAMVRSGAEIPADLLGQRKRRAALPGDPSAREAAGQS